jgi:uncharacterized phage-associated protein
MKETGYDQKQKLQQRPTVARKRRARVRMALTYKPKREKILELLLYMAHKRPNADQYQTVKFFYLADTAHFNRYGRPITYEQYFALPYGPVASNTLNLIKGHQRTLNAFNLKTIDDLPVKIEKLDQLIYVKGPKRAVNYEVFSKSDIAVFDEILKEYGAHSFDDLYQLTHRHFAYRNAWDNRAADSRSAPMTYDDMFDESAKKKSFIEDTESIAHALNENR